MRKSTLAAIVVFCAGMTVLGGTVWMLARLDGFRLDAVEAGLQASVAGPGLSLSIVGHNPLPFSMQAMGAQIRVRLGQTPIQVEWKFLDETRFPAGDFNVPLARLVPASGSIALTLGGRELSSPGQDEPFEGTVTVKVGPFEKQVPFNGKLRLKLGMGG